MFNTVVGHGGGYIALDESTRALITPGVFVLYSYVVCTCLSRDTLETCRQRTVIQHVAELQL